MAVGGLRAIVPPSGSCSPARVRNSVDLPAPFAPTNPMTSPGATTRSSPAKSSSSPYPAASPLTIIVPVTVTMVSIAAREPRSVRRRCVVVVGVTYGAAVGLELGHAQQILQLGLCVGVGTVGQWFLEDVGQRTPAGPLRELRRKV